MTKYWTINDKGKYSSLTVARMHASRQYLGVVWGNPHQGPNGKMRIVGKTSETNDVIIIEQK